MPAIGSSSISSSGSCISSMPISSHCFWPCESRPAWVCKRFQADLRGHRLHPRHHIRRA
jgi:hypothetical protein